MEEKIQHNVLLKDHTTFKIGGPAKYFFIAQDKQEIIEAIKWARQKSAPFFILGGGSKLLVSDKGFDGLVIKIKNQKLKIKNCNENFEVCVFAEAGVPLSALLKSCLEQGLSGLEWASGIPGITVGGAIRGNAGAFGRRMADVIKEAEVFDAFSSEVKKIKVGECGFSCKQSIFKKNSRLVILSALLVLKKQKKEEVKKEVFRVLNYRKQNHPALPSAGCIFENPDDKTPAGKLIAQAGLSGEKRGRAQISEKHSNFIVNLGGASSEDVLKLIELCKEKVKAKFGIVLKEEIQCID